MLLKTSIFFEQLHKLPCILTVGIQHKIIDISWYTCEFSFLLWRFLHGYVWLHNVINLNLARYLYWTPIYIYIKTKGQCIRKNRNKASDTQKYLWNTWSSYPMKTLNTIPYVIFIYIYMPTEIRTYIMLSTHYLSYFGVLNVI